MDIKIQNEEQNFKFRVNSVIMRDNKVLLVSINNNDFLCCPGGHVNIGEDTITAVIRETKEEVGVDCRNPKLISVMENFFRNKKNVSYHELSFFYLVTDVDIPQEKMKDYSFIENDEGTLVNLDFKWVPIDDIDNYNIRPLVLQKILKEKDFSFNHVLIK